MKINKGISVLLASMLMGGMLVGCGNNSNSDTTKALTKTVKDVTKDDTEVEVTKDKEKEFSPQDNNKSSEKQVNTKKDNNKSTQKDTNQKEIKSTQKKSNKNTTKEEPSNKHKCWLCKKNITNKNFGGYSEDGTMICYRCLNKYGKDEPEEPKEDDETDECSICGGHVGGKEMCECDGTIHHRSCHVDAYSCPSCNRYGLNLDPDIYGCPYCGYPNEEHQESSDVEEYNDEVDIINDTDEDINY